jgi:hypothetical protein
LESFFPQPMAAGAAAGAASSAAKSANSTDDEAKRLRRMAADCTRAIPPEHARGRAGDGLFSA